MVALIIIIVVFVIIAVVAHGNSNKDEKEYQTKRYDNLNTKTDRIKKTGHNKTRVSVQELKSKNLLNNLPVDIFIKYLKTGKSYIDIDTDVLEAAKKKRDDYKNSEKGFNDIINLRNKAKALEKQKKSSEALEIYLQSIGLGERSEQLSINNYAYDIQRAIILYGKLKEFEKLSHFLQDKINRYPDLRDKEIKDWKNRLEKANQKLSK